MFQTDQPTAASSLPTPAAAGTPGYFTNGNPATGVAATILDADFINMTMMELINVVQAAGITPSKTTYTQVRDAINALAKANTPGRLLNVQVFKTHGTFTYTKTAGTTAAFAECHGAGASGAGTPTTGASQCAVGGPGASGAYASAWFSTGIPNGTTITVGQGGAAVNGGGSNGASSSIGSMMTAPGGRTGTTAGPSTPPLVTGGGSGATGVATVTGGTPIITTSGRSAGLSFANGLGTTAIAGSQGADGQWGGGGAITAGNTPGNSSSAPGAGGAGTATNASQASIAGGAGSDGFVSIYEYGSA